MIKNENDYEMLRGQVRRFTTINGIRRAAKMLEVSPNTLQKFITRQPIRPSSLEKIDFNFNR